MGSGLPRSNYSFKTISAGYLPNVLSGDIKKSRIRARQTDIQRTSGSNVGEIAQRKALGARNIIEAVNNRGVVIVNITQPVKGKVVRAELVIGSANVERAVTVGMEVALEPVVHTCMVMAGGAGLGASASNLHIPEQGLAKPYCCISVLYEEVQVCRQGHLHGFQ